jgi:hypothetical protein
MKLATPATCPGPNGQPTYNGCTAQGVTVLDKLAQQQVPDRDLGRSL